MAPCALASGFCLNWFHYLGYFLEYCGKIYGHFHDDVCLWIVWLYSILGCNYPSQTRFQESCVICRAYTFKTLLNPILISKQMVNAFSNFAALYASYFYPSTDGPRYVKANILNVAFSGLCILMATGLRILLKRRNSNLNKYAALDMAEENTTRGSKTMAYAEPMQCHPDYRFQL